MLLQPFPHIGKFADGKWTFSYFISKISMHGTKLLCIFISWYYSLVVGILKKVFG